MKITIFFIIFFLLFCIFIFKPYIIHVSKNTNNFDDTLKKIAINAIKMKDVPVGAILLYDTSIIGIGYNTVLKDSCITGHAEINAIQNAVNIMGFYKFGLLKKNKLTIITTFEPCNMCAGVLEVYQIKNTIIYMRKSFSYKLKEMKLHIKYLLNQYSNNNDKLQFDLFKLHPMFDSTKFK